jgi:N6-adenosine-specific RNA methylase IME4
MTNVGVPVLTIPPWPTKTYDIVEIDPPWNYYNGNPDATNKATKHYVTMTLADIQALPVRALMGHQGAVFLWATCPRLADAIHTLEAWQLHYRGVAFVWMKTSKRGGVTNGFGVTPTAVKPQTELVLFATTQPTGRPFPLLKLNVPQVIQAPRARHSEKPAIVETHIVELFGDRPRIELFARNTTPGWDVWGHVERGLWDPEPEDDEPPVSLF